MNERRPSVSVVLTLHDRPAGTVLAVLESLCGQGQEETVVVLDRTRAELAHLVRSYPIPGRRIFPIIEGAPGWREPVASWNLGLEAATCDLTFCLSSDVVLAPRNVERARGVLASIDCAVFGMVTDSEFVAEPAKPHGLPVLCSSGCPRPLGFVWALPTWAMRRAGGYDPAFADGQGAEDLDLSYRLWSQGLHFIFWDAIAGVHQAHPRPHLDRKLMARNDRIFRERWGRQTIAHDRSEIRAEIEPGQPEAFIWRNPRARSIAA